MKLLFPLLLIASAPGCANTKHFVDNYMQIEPVYFQTENGGYRIIDRVGSSSMLVSPDLGGAALGGAARGLTFGFVGRSSQVEMEQAAAIYFARAGRSCKVVGARAMDEPVWELRYTCEPNKYAEGGPRPPR